MKCGEPTKFWMTLHFFTPGALHQKFGFLHIYFPFQGFDPRFDEYIATQGELPSTFLLPCIASRDLRKSRKLLVICADVWEFLGNLVKF